MKIHEYQGKEILRQFGVPVPRGIPAFTVQEAVEAAQKLGGPVWVVKAQIHAGGRGKGGGVKVAKTIDDVKRIALPALRHRISDGFAGIRHRIVRMQERKIPYQRERARFNLFQIGRASHGSRLSTHIRQEENIMIAAGETVPDVS